MRLRHLPIKQKLMLATLATTTLALLVLSIALAVFELVTFRQEALNASTAVARVTAANSVAALEFADQEAAKETLEALGAEPAVLAAAVYDSEGKLFEQYRRAGTEVEVPLRHGTESSEFFGTTLRLVQPVQLDGRIRGWVWLVTDLSPLYRRLAFYGLLIVGGSPRCCSVGFPRRLPNWYASRRKSRSTMTTAGAPRSMRTMNLAN
jgi:uncharacterized membrane protein affecting hemolysin expression